ncbi:transposable element Tcb1 transposase [Trichonephila clavipes]|nr:transposable element Tcb1 transposase [Trichonephila clavipes]
MRRCLAEGHLGSRRPLCGLPLNPTNQRLGAVPRTRKLDCSGMNQVVFRDESRFNLSSDDCHVREWRPRGERLNRAVSLQQHTTSTAGVTVWGVIAYNIRSRLVLIRGTMTAQRYVHDFLQPHVLPLMQRLSGTFFNKTMLGLTRQGCIRLPLHSYCPSLGCLIPRFVSNQAYLGLFGTESWASYEFERTRAKVTADTERNVSRHYTEPVCLNSRSYRIMHSR